MGLTVICTGGRDFNDEALVGDVLDYLEPERIVVGDCPTGVDHYVFLWAKENGVPCKVFEANWKDYGKAAGPRRNREMLVENVSEDKVLVVAFPGGRGTEDCASQAKKHNFIVLRVDTSKPN